MVIKKNNKVLIIGRTICLVAGLLTAVCGIYWIVRALAMDDVDLLSILSSISCSLFLMTYYLRNR